jgi:flagellar motor protein MotB
MSGHREGDGFAHSMTDLMAGVAVTFLILAAIFMVQASNGKRVIQDKAQQATEDQKKLQALKDVDEASKKALALLKGTLDSSQYTTKTDKNDPFLLIVTFDSESLFSANECTLNAKAKENVATKVYGAFKAVCDPNLRAHLHSIVLEGHTDSTPFFGSRRCGAIDGCEHVDCPEEGFRNNVRLSAARAQEVFFEARNVMKERDAALMTECLDKYFSVVGRGPVEPADGTTWRPDAGPQPKDRRVVMKVRVRSQSAILFDGGAP